MLVVVGCERGCFRFCSSLKGGGGGVGCNGFSKSGELVCVHACYVCMHAMCGIVIFPFVA